MRGAAEAAVALLQGRDAELLSMELKQMTVGFLLKMTCAFEGGQICVLRFTGVFRLTVGAVSAPFRLERIQIRRADPRSYLLEAGDSLRLSFRFETLRILEHASNGVSLS